MKRLIILVIIGWTIYSCSVPKEYSIDFCTNLNSDIECEQSKTVFEPGNRVYILFECNQPFSEKKVTGNFYYIDKTEKISLGSQDWKINPGDSYAYDYVDFKEKGVYEFEFLNENNEVLARKKLEIK
jgi:hypothetical protein